MCTPIDGLCLEPRSKPENFKRELSAANISCAPPPKEIRRVGEEKSKLFWQVRMSSFSLKKCGQPLLAVSGSSKIRVMYIGSNSISCGLISSVSP